MINYKTDDDLKAFERRLIEIIACYHPQTKRWRILLLIVTLTTSITAFQWLTDPRTHQISSLESLRNHLLFTLNLIILAVLFAFGVHKRVIAPAIIVSRIKQVLRNYNMSCDQTGRLIIKRSSIYTPGSNNSDNISKAIIMKLSSPDANLF